MHADAYLRLHSVTFLFQFVSMLRPDSHTYVDAVVGVSFYITPLDFPMLS